MKKLLSICFLSILLGLLSFSVSAQVGAGQNCKSGFWIENLQPDVVTGIVNLGLPAPGELELKHTLGSAFLNPNTGAYLGNAHLGVTELYEVHFCNTCNLDPKTKISLDWMVIRDGDTINENLSEYLDLSIYTFYNNLNVYNPADQGQSISWLGGKVVDGFGYCESQAINTGNELLDTIYGVNGPNRDPQGYPGAMQVEQGTPNAVLTQLGLVVPANGMVNIYTQALDYFYLDFFQQTRNIVVVKWKQPGNYKLVMRVRQRTGGTPWPNMTWNENETTDFVGGHQSVCGAILAEDIIGYPTFGELSKEICNYDDPFIFGRPEYAFHVDMDTNVVFGDTMFPGSGACEYFQVDSIYALHFDVRHNPVVAVRDTAVCKCQPVDVMSLVTLDQTDVDDQTVTSLKWNNGGGWQNTITYYSRSKNAAGDSIYTYKVRQINTYHDTLDCEGDVATFTVTFKEFLPPVVTPDTLEFCLDAIDTNTVITVNSVPDPNCTNSTLWYTTSRYYPTDRVWNERTRRYEYYSDNFVAHLTGNPLEYVGNNLQIKLSDYIPKHNVNKDTVVYFFAVSYNTESECKSSKYSILQITFHQTPVLTNVTPLEFNICPGAEAEMKVKINNNTTPAYDATPYTYMWDGSLTSILFNNVKTPYEGNVEKTIGSGTSTTKYYPFYKQRKNSYSQQIYLASEMEAGLITKIAYYATESFTRDNVTISFAETDVETFASTNAWITEGLETVYTGTVSATNAGWTTITLDKPYIYNGEKNLVVAVNAASTNTGSNKGVFRISKAPGIGYPAYTWYKTLYVSNDNSPVGPNKTGDRDSYRNNIKFTIESAYTTNDKNQTAYNQTSANDTCHTPYTTSVYVIDGNGCVSEPVTFNYISEDTLKPNLGPVAHRTDVINACDLDASANGNAAPYTTIDEFVAHFNLRVSDNCSNVEDLTLSHTDVVTPVTDTTCEAKIVRTYKVIDHCGNDTTFIHTIIAHDSVAPIFRTPEDGTTPYIRMIPVRDENCTYNAPSKEVFVRTILPVLYDSCTSMTYDWVYNHSEFYWENSELFDSVKAPDTKDIFRNNVGNQLTVRAFVTDKCGNEANAMILYFNRPVEMYVQNPSLSISKDSICLGETVTLTFDSTKVTFDQDFEVAHPLHYEWTVLESNAAVVTPNNYTTEFTPTVGDMLYHVKMKVTDALGCEAVSEIITLNVKSIPNVKIKHVVLNGQVEPYCPNYGVLTIAAVDAVTEQPIPNLTYAWSGESVNNLSTTDTSFVSILPDRCSWVYWPVVDVEDIYFGCTATATVPVSVIDSVGPQYYGDVIRDTVAMEAGCKYYVPNFMQYLNNANIIDNCYPFSTYTFRQDPAVDADMTEMGDVVSVTIYVTTPCDETEYAIRDKFFAYAPIDRLHVTATVDDAVQCEPANFTLSASVENAHGNVDWKWTRNDVNQVKSTSQSFTDNNVEVKNHADSTMYSYTVKATDALGCTDNTSVTVKVYKAIITLDTISYANSHCEAPYNGTFVVYHAPRSWGYDLVNQAGQHIIASEVPGLDPSVPENTRIFDYLQDGDYQLFVTTDHNCISGPHNVHIGNVQNDVVFVAGEIEAHNPTYCTNDNGYIVINNQTGYSYKVVNVSTGEEVSLPYTGLTDGLYNVTKTNNTTKCRATTPVRLNPSGASLPAFTVTTNPNTLCGDVKFDGQLILPAKDNFYYIVNHLTDQSSDVIYTGNATTIDSLPAGRYTVFAQDTVTGCYGNSTNHPVVIENDRPQVNFTVEHTNNNYCSNTDNLVNGSITYRPAATYTYTVTDQAGEVVTNLTALAAGQYTVKAVSAEGCVATKYVTINDELYYPSVTNIKREANASCDPDVLAFSGSVEFTVGAVIPNGASTTNAFDYIKPYTVVFDTLDPRTNLISNKVKFEHLDGDNSYNYTITSKYFCSYSNNVRIEQKTYPALTMHATPNTMCEPTFEHPGNGTIVMDTTTVEGGRAYYRDQNFEYSYYYAVYNSTTQEYEAGDQLLIPYWVPISYTLYNLPDSLYYVNVYDRLTGCSVHGTIAVPLGRDHVVIDATTSANKNCIAPFDGTVTVEATPYKLNTTSVNVDAVLEYSLVGTDVTYPYQSSNIFTGVKDGDYTVMVRDTTTGCVYVKDIPVTVGKTPSNITITPTITPNHACVIPGDDTPYDGTLSVVATTTTFNPATFVYSFMSDNAYDTVHSWNQLAPTSYKVYAKEVASGCVQDSTFTISTDNYCTPDFAIGSNNHNNNEFHFCLNAENAQIFVKNVTLADGCVNEGFDYEWSVSCHTQHYYGDTVNIPTDEVHCCTYTVTVTSRATHCQAVKTVTVCIDSIHSINYLVNRVPFYNNPRIIRNFCVNEDVMIGIVRNNWVSASWSNGHTGNEFEFDVPAFSTKADSMYSYCVDVVDINGCSARGVINLIKKHIPTGNTNDTLCSDGSITFENPYTHVETTITYATSQVDPETHYGYYTYNDTITNRPTSNGCDSVSIHHIVFIPKPVVTVNSTPNSICYGMTVKQYVNTYFTITNAVDTTYEVRIGNGILDQWNVVNANYVLPYNTQCNSIYVRATGHTISFNGGNSCVGVGTSNGFKVNKAPAFTEALVLSPYCADGGQVNIAVPANDRNVCSGTYAYKALLIDTLEDQTVRYLNAGTINNGNLIFTPRVAYDSMYLAFVLTNSCGVDTVSARLNIDSTWIKIQNNTYCEGDVINIDAALGKHYNNVKVWKLTPNTNPIKEEYTPGTALTLNDTNYYFFYEVTGEVCSPMLSDTQKLVINPLPRLTVDQVSTDLCKVEAANVLAAAVHPQFADAQGWLYGAHNATRAQLTSTTSVDEVVTAVKSLGHGDVYYYANNDCGKDTMPVVMNLRILDSLHITGTPSVIVCHNADLQTVKNALPANPYTTDRNNYTANEVEIVYLCGNSVLSPADEIGNCLVGNRLTVVYRPKAGVYGCTADTTYVTINFYTNGIDTFKLQPACATSKLSEFIETAPKWTGSAPLVDSFWTVSYNNTVTYLNQAQLATTTVPAAQVVNMKHSYVNTCGDTVSTLNYSLTINDVPEVTVNDYIIVCAGETISKADVGLNVVYHGHEANYDTTWTVNDVDFDFTQPLTYADSGKKLVVTVGPRTGMFTCGSSSDTLVLRVRPLPVVELNGPSFACDSELVAFVATPNVATYTYQFKLDGVDVNAVGNTYETVLTTTPDEPTVFYTVSVVATDQYGCSSASVDHVIRVTRNAEFRFYDSVATATHLYTDEHETHDFTSVTGTGLQYTWMVDRDCYDKDKLVYVEYDFYFKGENDDEYQKISNDDRGNYFIESYSSDVYHNIFPWITSNSFNWLNGDGSDNGNTSYLDFTVANPHSISEGNHFPYTNLGLSNDDTYDDLWMHFLDERPVTTVITPFRKHGDYKVVYRLYATSNVDIYQNPYRDEVTGEIRIIGGQNSLSGNPTLTLLACDSINVEVSGEDIPAPTPNETVAPSVAPSLVVDENVAPTMEVWPNPAPAIQTTLKARVHNMAGNATVTFTNLNGKQVYNGELYIDNDNYYFEFNVTNLSVGTYILTVRTGDAVITKKVIVNTSR